MYRDILSSQVLQESAQDIQEGNGPGSHDADGRRPDEDNEGVRIRRGGGTVQGPREVQAPQDQGVQGGNSIDSIWFSVHFYGAFSPIEFFGPELGQFFGP